MNPIFASSGAPGGEFARIGPNELAAAGQSPADTVTPVPEMVLGTSPAKTGAKFGSLNRLMPLCCMVWTDTHGS
jgi:hypothetical protein